jgi:hypothetical protein
MSDSDLSVAEAVIEQQPLVDPNLQAPDVHFHFVEDEPPLTEIPIIDDGSVDVIPPKEQEIVLKIPIGVPLEVVHTAINIGRIVSENAGRGIVTLVYPAMRPGATPSDAPISVLGKTDILVKDQKDIDRLVRLAKTISQVNMETFKKTQAGGPIAEVAAVQSGEILKDNMTEDMVAQTNGHAGGIHIATG